MGTKNEAEEIEFDWVKLRYDMDSIMQSETFIERCRRKFGENPLVPLGALATTVALVYGLWCFRTGEQRKSQYMMRSRIAAQGFTVVALIIGMGLSAKKAAAEQATSQP